MRLATALALVGLSLAVPCFSPAAERSPATLLELEETNELRLERLMNTKGKRALVQHLAAELQVRPRPYIKAWYANYQLYGKELGVADIADPTRGFELAKEAAAEGSLFGLELVARAHGDGRGTVRNVPEALRRLREAAERGRDTAMAELAKYYFFGSGVPADRNVAEDWARQAAYRGAATGLWNLAQWWEDPQYTKPPSRPKANALYYEVGELGSKEALALLRQRAHAGDRDAERYVHLDLVVSAMRGYDASPEKLKEAVKWLEKNASPDDTQVQLALAEVMLERELKVYDPSAAIAKTEYARSRADADALALEAVMAWRGIGQKKNEAQAIAMWRELATRNHPRGLHQLGWLHWWGNGQKHGVAKDAAKAFALCQQAADLGYWAAQLSVAECHAQGIGTPVNPARAAKYYGLLENRRYKNATRMKNRILALVKD